MPSIVKIPPPIRSSANRDWMLDCADPRGHCTGNCLLGEVPVCSDTFMDF